MLSLRAAGRHAEEAEAAVHLAWAQTLDGRTWQAARTLQDVVGGRGFTDVPTRFCAWAHLLYAWALFDLGEYAQWREQAQIAYSLADSASDRAQACLNMGQIALHSGERRRAERYFDEAVRLQPRFRASVFSIKAYLNNLAGRHKAALKDSEAGLIIVHNTFLEIYDNTNRAVERSALMVERGTAKAFLGHADAEAALAKAQSWLDTLSSDKQLESARVKRARALVLAKAGEKQAALALLDETLRFFHRRSARPEYDLTARALHQLLHERRAKATDDNFSA
jgi:tetratricopeptide (TPR) repeat protein